MGNRSTAGRRAPLLAGFGGIVLSLAIAAAWQAWSQSEGHRLAVLASAAPQRRTFEGRLAAFPYRAFAPRTARGPIAASLFDDPQSLAFLAVSNRVFGNHTPQSAADYHLAGVANLVAGAREKAVESLEHALILVTAVRDPQRASQVANDYALLTDLSTAYGERGTANHKAVDYIRALSCADRAWRLRATPETAWNRALALQRLHLNDDAREAWQAYLRIEHSSEWATEARTRIAATDVETESNLWSHDGGRISDLPLDRVEQLAQSFPLHARRAAEKQLLPAWAAATLVDDDTKAAATLDRLDAIGATLEKRSGEALIRDTTTNLRSLSSDRSATKRVARAIALIGAAKAAYDQANGPECRAKLRAAIPDLRRYRNPFVQYARFYIASSYYFDNDYASLRREAATLSDIPARYLALHAQTSWIAGLGEMSVGKPDAALPHYDAALAEFTRLRESDNVASVHNLMAEAYDYLDSADQAWAHRERALDIVSRVGSAASNYPQLLQQAAQLLLAMHQPAVAKIFLDRAVKIPGPDDPLFTADTICWQAVALRQLGFDADANAAWRRATAVASRIAMAALRERALNDVTMTRALTSERVTPDEVRRAVAFTRSSDNRWALPRMLQLQADVFAVQGAYDDAMRSYRAAVDEIVAQRRRTTLAQYELLNRATLSDATEHAVSLAVKRGDLDAAFAFSEHSAGAAFPLAQMAPAPVPPNVAVVKIVCISDRMLVRTITSGRIHDRQIAAGIESIRAAADDASIHPEAAARLSAMIVSPDAIGAGVDTLVFVPDAAVAAIPFEALPDPTTGEPLLQRYVIAQCSTVGGYLHAATNANGRPLLVDGSEPGDLPRLPQAAEEIRELRHLYSGAALWKSDDPEMSTLTHALADAGLIHVAAHAVVDRSNEQMSTLVLGAKKAIYAHEIAGIRLTHHPIVVLSACSGAETPQFRRRRAPTFADAFLAAGASAVVASTKAIEDARARRFSLLLHERLSRGIAVGRAVREIQMKFAREGQTWNDLVIVGNPAAVYRFAAGPQPKPQR